MGCWAMHQGTWGVALHRDTAEETSMWRLCSWEHGELPCIETRLKKPVCGGYVAGNMGSCLA